MAKKPPSVSEATFAGWLTAVHFVEFAVGALH